MTRLRYSRCEHTDGRGRCRADGTVMVLPFLRPQPPQFVLGSTWSSNLWVGLCEKHAKKAKRP